MKIFVTGLTGFVGQRLASLLGPADEIHALCRSERTLLSGINIVEGDLGDLKSLAGKLTQIRPDVCIHLAWEGIPDYGFEMSKRNLDQGAALFRLLVEECGCRKIIAMGSCWEYGQSFGACREDAAGPVHSYFAWTKRSLHDLGMTLSEKNRISFVWLRAFYIYGPHQKFVSLIPTLAAALCKGEAPPVRTPWNANDFVYVDDVAQALIQALRSDIPSGVYNLGSGKATHIWEVCEALERSLGREPVHALKLKALDAEPIANFWADMAKTKKVLDWRAKTLLQEGVRRYINSLEAKA